MELLKIERDLSFDDFISGLMENKHYENIVEKTEDSTQVASDNEFTYE